MEKPVGALDAVKQQLRPLEFSDWKPNLKDIREDGSLKGLGFLGPLKRPNGGISSEISIGVNVGGKEITIPTMVPSLAAHEVHYLLHTPEEEIQHADPEIYKSIEKKAVNHAKQRMLAGKPFFAEDWESPTKPPVLF